MEGLICSPTSLKDTKTLQIYPIRMWETIKDGLQPQLWHALYSAIRCNALSKAPSSWTIQRLSWLGIMLLKWAIPWVICWFMRCSTSTWSGFLERVPARKTTRSLMPPAAMRDCCWEIVAFSEWIQRRLTPAVTPGSKNSCSGRWGACDWNHQGQV